MKMLYLQASPRKAKSHCQAIGDAFMEAWRKYHPESTVNTLNVFDIDMPEMNGDAVEERYLASSGQTETSQHSATWSKVEEEAKNFGSYGCYTVASPMWNYHIPYKLKQYIDVIFQPGITFNTSDEQAELMAKKHVCFILARGGMYSHGSPLDFQKPYLEHIFARMGFLAENMRWIIIEPTADTPKHVKELHTLKIAEALTLAKAF